MSAAQCRGNEDSSCVRATIAGALCLVGLLGCPHAPRRQSGAAPSPRAARTFEILAVNDVYRIEGVDQGTAGGLARLRTLRLLLERDHPDLLVLHAGDLLFPSLLSRAYEGAQMVDVMNVLDGDATARDGRLFVTFGNHEFEKGDIRHAAMLRQRIDESQFTWLGSNLSFVEDADGKPLVASANLAPSAIVVAGGVRVGLFSISTGVKSADYVRSFEDPKATARAYTAKLRGEGAEVVIALTHLEMDEDRDFVRALGPAGPDIVIGGHDHKAQAEDVAGRPILKADADARRVTVADVTLAPDGRISVAHRMVPLAERDPAPDAQVAARVEGWIARHEERFCVTERRLRGDCLEDVVGHTRTLLGGEEMRIRMYETSLGDWVADRMVGAFADRGAQGAFINAGTLRLNQDIPAGSPIRRRDIEELFGYPAPLRLIEIDGATLGEVLRRAVTGWSGVGWWLQVSGLAFRHDPKAETASDLTLLGPGVSRPIRPDERLRLVTVDYLVNPKLDQDGYRMLNPGQVIAEGPDLRDLVLEALARAEPDGIAPEVGGRICNAGEPGPCLAVGDTAGDKPPP